MITTPNAESIPTDPAADNRAAAPRFRARASGFSLVEVLVAIAILTVGIVAFLQLFPIGFYTLRVASNTSNADRLAQAELNRLTRGNGALIAQIAAIQQIYSDGSLQLDPSFSVDTALGSNSGLPASQSDGFTTKTGANPERYAYVSGELVNVPSPTHPAGGAATSNTLVDFGPIDLPYVGASEFGYPDLTRFNSLDPGAHMALFVHGRPWQRKVGDATPASAIDASSGATATVSHDDPEVELSPDSPAYLIDYNSGAIALRQPSNMIGAALATPPGNAQNYTQTFLLQVRDSDTSAGAVEPKTFILQADWTGTTTTGTAGTAGAPANVIPVWTSATQKPTWSYLAPTYAPAGANVTAIASLYGQQTLVLPLVPGSDKLVRDFKRVTGAFSSDPYEFKFANADLNTGSASAPATNLGALQFNPLAGQIVDDRGQPIQAAVDYIVHDWHTVHEDSTVGSQSGLAFGTTGNSVVRLTLNHLLRFHSPDQLGNLYTGVGGGGADVIVYNLDTLAPLSSPSDYTIDYDTGAITFANQPAGEHVRVFYHPAYDWGLSAIKPPASYTVVNKTALGGATTPTLTGQAVLDDTAERIYFPYCDQGRLVQLDGDVLVDKADTSTTPATHTTVAVPVHALLKLAAPTGSAAGTPSYYDLSSFVPANTSSPPASYTYTTSSLTATGASLTVRVIWRERDLWRSRDATTIDLPLTTAPAG